MITVPTNCPSCSSDLKLVNDILYCRNPSCKAKKNKNIEHFAKTLKIKGLGPATIEKLELQSIEDIYNLDESEIAEKLKSEKLAVKLIEEIGKSTKKPFNEVLPALGIPLVGKSATDKLSKLCKSVFDINEKSCKEAGLGNKVTDNLLSWVNLELESIMNLPISFRFKKDNVQKKNREVVCITGKLDSFKTKSEASEVLKSLGYSVSSTVTKNVTVLVNESGIESAKTRRARESGILIITNLKNYIGENNE